MRPKQRNAKTVKVLDDKAIVGLIKGATSDRWKAAIGLAAYGGLRLGELPGLRWEDVDFKGNELHVRRALLPDGTEKATKTEAGVRTVPMLPSLRRLLRTWKLASPKAKPADFVICKANAGAVEERNLRRALERAKTESKITTKDHERLSWHSLRHSFASMLATDLELTATTLARLTGTRTPASHSRSMPEMDVTE